MLAVAQAAVGSLPMGDTAIYVLGGLAMACSVGVAITLLMWLAR